MYHYVLLGQSCDCFSNNLSLALLDIYRLEQFFSVIDRNSFEMTKNNLKYRQKHYYGEF